MDVEEVIFYRSKQLFQKKLLDRLKTFRKKDYYNLVPRSSFSLPNYSQKFCDQFFKKYSLDSYELFSSAKINLVDNNSWRKDFKNDICSDKIFAGGINRQNYDKFGDIKYTAEISRFHFLPFLCLVSSGRKGKKYLNAVKKIIAQWSEQNPYLRSVHWTSGIEIAIRSVNLLYSYQILDQFGNLSADIEETLKEIICNSYDYLRSHLSKYSSANNHLIAELAGLVCISFYFSSDLLDKERVRWKKQLFKELHNQTNEDGINKELSTRYHAEVLDHFLNSFLFIERSGGNIPQKCREKLKSMFDFIHHTLGYKDSVMEFSDSDDGYLIYPYFDRGFNLYKSLLGSAYIYFDKSFINTPYRIDFRNYLMFGDSSTKLNDRSIESPLCYKDRLFNESGYCFFYDNEKKARIGFDVGKIGDEISAAHGHSDLLHFTFEISGYHYIVDTGTHQYHSNHIKWRDYFRGISAHNTISIEQKDHAIKNNRMSWINKPSIKVINQKEGDELSCCVAEHSAFEGDKVMHRRGLYLNKEKKVLMLKDKLSNNSNNKKRGTFYLHFHPDAEVVFKSDFVIAVKRSEQKEILLKNSFFKDANIIKGNEQIPLGWYSDSYDYKRECPTLVLRFELVERGYLELKTEVDYTNG